jgi:hypothetical protein
MNDTEIKMLSSYPSVYALGHRAIQEILTGPVVVEEKIDGSQFSMGRTLDGELVCRSKGQHIFVEKPEGMFAQAVDAAKQLPLTPGWTYRCEYLRVPKHNTLVYGRIPKNHLIVFDVMTGLETYLSPFEKRNEADRIGLDCVPCFHVGSPASINEVAEYLNRESCLGGCKIEGVVIKNYNLFTVDKKIAVAKFVSAEFKEKHGVEWKKSNPGRSDVIGGIVAALKTEARYRKGVQHLQERNELTQSLKDIGPLIAEVGKDVQKEEEQFIKDHLFNYFWPSIRSGVIAGVPDFYKNHLAEKSFQQ